MNKYVPKMYKKDIFEIDYDKLKENKIKCLMFDLDNTIVGAKIDTPAKEVSDLVKKLKVNFQVFVVSNNSHKKRLSNVSSALDVECIGFAMKPFAKGFKKIKNKYNFSKEEMCIIGDQIMTDVLGGNRYGIYTVLVDPLPEKELKVTGINRFFEKNKIKKLEKNGLFKKGEYYG